MVISMYKGKFRYHHAQLTASPNIVSKLGTHHGVKTEQAFGHARLIPCYRVLEHLGQVENCKALADLRKGILASNLHLISVSRKVEMSKSAQGPFVLCQNFET